MFVHYHTRYGTADQEEGHAASVRNAGNLCSRDGHGGRAGHGVTAGHSRADAKDVRTGEVRLVTEGAEDRVRAIEKCERRVELGDAAGVHDEDAVVVHCRRGR